MNPMDIQLQVNGTLIDNLDIIVIGLTFFISSVEELTMYFKCPNILMIANYRLQIQAGLKTQTRSR